MRTISDCDIRARRRILDKMMVSEIASDQKDNHSLPELPRSSGSYRVTKTSADWCQMHALNGSLELRLRTVTVNVHKTRRYGEHVFTNRALLDSGNLCIADPLPHQEEDLHLHLLPSRREWSRD